MNSGAAGTDALELECRLRFIDLCAANLGRSAPTDLDLYVEGFWAGVEASRRPRTVAVLEAAIGARRAVNAAEESRRALQMVREAGLETP